MENNQQLNNISGSFDDLNPDTVEGVCNASFSVCHPLLGYLDSLETEELVKYIQVKQKLKIEKLTELIDCKDIENNRNEYHYYLSSYVDISSAYILANVVLCKRLIDNPSQALEGSE